MKYRDWELWRPLVSLLRSLCPYVTPRITTTPFNLLPSAILSMTLFYHSQMHNSLPLTLTFLPLCPLKLSLSFQFSPSLSLFHSNVPPHNPLNLLLHRILISLTISSPSPTQAGEWRYRVENKADSHQSLYMRVWATPKAPNNTSPSSPSKANAINLSAWTSNSASPINISDTKNPVVVYARVSEREREIDR